MAHAERVRGDAPGHARRLPPVGTAAGEVVEAHREGLGGAGEGLLVEGTRGAKIATADVVPDARVDPQHRGPERRRPVAEDQVVRPELADEVRRRRLAVEQPLGDAFPGDRIDPGRLADQHHPGPGQGLMGRETALGVALLLACVQVEPHPRKPLREPPREVHVGGLLAGQDQAVDAPADQPLAPDHRGEIPRIAVEGRVGCVEMQQLCGRVVPRRRGVDLEHLRPPQARPQPHRLAHDAAHAVGPHHHSPPQLSAARLDPHAARAHLDPGDLRPLLDAQPPRASHLGEPRVELDPPYHTTHVAPPRLQQAPGQQQRDPLDRRARHVDIDADPLQRHLSPRADGPRAVLLSRVALPLQEHHARPKLGPQVQQVEPQR